MILYFIYTVIFAVASYYNLTDTLDNNYVISVALGIGLGYNLTNFIVGIRK